MTQPNGKPRIDGSIEDYMNDEERLLYGNRLSDDFPERLVRLKELADLTWSGFARAVGVDYRQMYKWRKHGVEPSGPEREAAATVTHERQRRQGKTKEVRRGRPRRLAGRAVVVLHPQAAGEGTQRAAHPGPRRHPLLHGRGGRCVQGVPVRRRQRGGEPMNAPTTPHRGNLLPVYAVERYTLRYGIW